MTTNLRRRREKITTATQPTTDRESPLEFLSIFCELPKLLQIRMAACPVAHTNFVAMLAARYIATSFTKSVACSAEAHNRDDGVICIGCGHAASPALLD